MHGGANDVERVRGGLPSHGRLVVVVVVVVKWPLKGPVSSQVNVLVCNASNMSRFRLRSGRCAPGRQVLKLALHWTPPKQPSSDFGVL